MSETVSCTFDRERLLGLIEHIKEKPEAGQTIWKAKTEWLGGFRSQAQIRDFTVSMDEPDALGGSNTSPNMVEVVLGAYGCCLTTGYAMNAGLRGIELEAYRMNTAASVLYRTLGFRRLARERYAFDMAEYEP